ncbi:hypothetical protein J4221_03020 [Candidatus Pacearchaeota archaeon]|nr:hypothetical protein [Candidatus Pacearchaeota archaeon]
MDKKVYFAGAIRGDRSLAETIISLIRYIKEDLGCLVLTEHVGSERPVEKFAKKIGKSMEELLAEDIESQDIYWLDQCSRVIAEISGASTGTGREIEYARTKGYFGKIPAEVLCIYRLDREYFASPMIRGMRRDRYPNVSVRSYRDLVEAKQIVRDFLEI